MESYYTRRRDCDTVEVDDEDSLMIINTDDSTVTHLNGTGSWCWSMLEERQNADSLAQSLLESQQKSDQSDTDFLELKKDIQAFLDKMVTCGLIENA
ncbi:PqqD family protein [Sporolactobacillus pectinivorans]|uniref:PqqD family protein n=1 Tax=Sporolactobacillus pectinivorans TaxID=1591408 RepID=UPI000C2581BA|nr:PqqD family protein [Sporolactobacillus pectinivorans]